MPLVRVEAGGLARESRRRVGRVVGQLLGVGDPAEVVDRDVDTAPDDAAVATAPVGRDPMTAAMPDPAAHIGG